MPWGRWFGFGRGPGYWATGLPGWARDWPRGYCWYYYQQTGQFPPWSPWASSDTQSQINYLETVKRNLEEELKTLQNQINELKKKLGEKK